MPQTVSVSENDGVMKVYSVPVVQSQVDVGKMNNADVQPNETMQTNCETNDDFAEVSPLQDLVVSPGPGIVGHQPL